MATAFAMAITPMAAGYAVAAAPAPAPARVPDALSVAAKAALEALDAAVALPAEEPAPSEPVPTDPVTPVVDDSGTVTVVPVVESVAGEAAVDIGSTEGVSEPAAEIDPLAEAMAAVAALVAERGGVDAELLIEAWSTTTEQRYRVILAALAQVGDGYRYASSGPDLFDCSGLSKYAWGTVGVKLWHNSSRQIAGAYPRKVDQLLPGDLVWRPGHVMLYLGVEQLIVNAVQPGKTVSVRQWGKAYRYGSPIEDPPAAEPSEA